MKRADIMTARAVAPIERAVDLFGPAILQGSKALLYKGPDVEAEITEAMPALKKRRIHARVVARYDMPREHGVAHRGGNGPLTDPASAQHKLTTQRVQHFFGLFAHARMDRRHLNHGAARSDEPVETLANRQRCHGSTVSGGFHHFAESLQMIADVLDVQVGIERSKPFFIHVNAGAKKLPLEAEDDHTGIDELLPLNAKAQLRAKPPWPGTGMTPRDPRQSHGPLA